MKSKNTKPCKRKKNVHIITYIRKNAKVVTGIRIVFGLLNKTIRR